MQKIARCAINLFDANPFASGAMHAQAQRFLNHGWTGVRGDSPVDDPPLRTLVQALADGDSLLSEFLADTNPTIEICSFLRWIAAFRHVPQLNCSSITPPIPPPTTHYPLFLLQGTGKWVYVF